MKRAMELKILGCHGGESPDHKTSSFLIDGRIAIDAGAVTSMLVLEEQNKIESVLVSHAHFDHVKDLATLADNRCQQGGPTLNIVGVPATIAALKTHFFNDLLWPNFANIPTPLGPTIRFVEIQPEETLGLEASGAIADNIDKAPYRVRAIEVHHTIDTCAFILENESGAIGYSGDTGPTDRLWEVLSTQENLSALLMEVSFPNEHHRLAQVSGHHTPESLGLDLAKLHNHPHLPILMYHIKPVFEARVEKELTRLRKLSLQISRLGDRYLF